MSAPKRYIVEENRRPKTGETYIDDHGELAVASYNHITARLVIVEELTPPPHPLAGTYRVEVSDGCLIHRMYVPENATHILVIADDGTCTLTEATS